MNIDIENFLDEPKIAALSNGAFRLHVGALDYCARLDTTDTVPLVLVPTLMPRYRRAYLTELVLAGLWHHSPGTVDGTEWVEIRES